MDKGRNYEANSFVCDFSQGVGQLAGAVQGQAKEEHVLASHG
jgi:hypothetical protein